MITMFSDLPDRYTEADAKADQAEAAIRKTEARVLEWLQDNPQVGRLNSGKFYVYPAGGQYQEIEAFAAVPS